MKKILSLLLITCALISLVSCGGSGYEPVESSELEKATVMTVTVDGEKYAIRYELYRALFLSCKAEVDGGDASVWSGDKKDEYIAKAEEIILDKAAEIYSVLHLAKKAGIDIYSDEYDEIISETIKETVDAEGVGGFGGDYQKYLDYLKEMNLNYSVQDLLFRYHLATDALYDHYAGTLDGEFVSESAMGALKYTREDVEAFYYDDGESVRVQRIYIPKDYTTPERIREIRTGLVDAAAGGDGAAERYILDKRGASSSIADVKNGILHGRHSEDSLYYEEMTEAAFSLGVGEVSEIIEVSTTSEEAYVIMYRIAKNNQHFADCYDSIAEVYVYNEIGKLIDGCSSALIESAVRAPMLSTLDRGGITMD